MIARLAFLCGLLLFAVPAYAGVSDCSGTVGTTAVKVQFTKGQPLEYIEFTNPHATATLWINPTGGVAAANAAGSGAILPGGYVWFQTSATSQVSIVASDAATPFTCWYR